MMDDSVTLLVVWLAVLACAVAVSPYHESATLAESADDELTALLDDAERQSHSDLGEGDSVPINSGAGAQNLAPLGGQGHHVSFEFQQAVQAAKKMGHDAPMIPMATGPEAKAHEMIQLGNLLENISGKGDVYRNQAVSSLKQAIQTKLLMDELKPGKGSFARTMKQLEADRAKKQLGEQEKASPLSHFSKLLKSKNKNLMAITRYLLMRKKMGRPLTSAEDEELQNFYYSRASHVLKKILLLKHGGQSKNRHQAATEEAPDNTPIPSAQEEHAEREVLAARNHAAAVVERLQFDAKVAQSNAAYNKKMLGTRERREKAAQDERKQAEQEELKAAKEKLIYDAKVADAKENYNEALSSELLQRKKVAEGRVIKAASEKRKADLAAAQASAAAREADKEARDAEMEAEAATKRAEELEKKEMEKEARMAAKAKLRGHEKQPAKPKGPEEIPLTVFPHTHLDSLLRYLQSALNQHLKITPEEQQLMQSFFLKRGSALLSSLAQVDPDATWHSTGVVREEQYEMDREHPDQLSREWGSKNLRDDTVVTDFVHDALWARPSDSKLARPGHQEVEGIFGRKNKISLKFAADNSAPTLSEPNLGESSDMDDADDTVERMPGAMSAMLGVGGQ